MFEEGDRLKATGDRRTTLRARYVFPVDGPPIADAAVRIEGGRIVAVGQMIRERCGAAAEMSSISAARRFCRDW